MPVKDSVPRAKQRELEELSPFELSPLTTARPFVELRPLITARPFVVASIEWVSSMSSAPFISAQPKSGTRAAKAKENLDSLKTCTKPTYLHFVCSVTDVKHGDLTSRIRVATLGRHNALVLRARHGTLSRRQQQKRRLSMA